jgi:hypothetical protein
MNKMERSGIFAGDDPFEIAKSWLAEAEESEINDPNAVALATVDEHGLPNVRMVLLKEITNTDFWFYTNYESAKAREAEDAGKAAMVLALTRPDLVNRLIVADIAPVAYTHSQIQFIDAMRSVDLSRVEKRSDAAAQLAAHVQDPSLQAFFTQSLDVKDKRWTLNLDALANEMPKILGFPDVTGRFEKPTLFLSGAESDYVTPDHRPAIKALFPKARFAKLPGAGHWLHAEKPRAFEASVRAFLDQDQ